MMVVIIIQSPRVLHMTAEGRLHRACASLVPMVRELRGGPWGGGESGDVEKETTLA